MIVAAAAEQVFVQVDSHFLPVRFSHLFLYLSRDHGFSVEQEWGSSMEAFQVILHACKILSRMSTRSSFAPSIFLLNPFKRFLFMNLAHCDSRFVKN